MYIVYILTAFALYVGVQSQSQSEVALNPEPEQIPNISHIFETPQDKLFPNQMSSGLKYRWKKGWRDAYDSSDPNMKYDCTDNNLREIATDQPLYITPGCLIAVLRKFAGNKLDKQNYSPKFVYDPRLGKKSVPFKPRLGRSNDLCD